MFSASGCCFFITKERKISSLIFMQNAKTISKVATLFCALNLKGILKKNLDNFWRKFKIDTALT